MVSVAVAGLFSSSCRLCFADGKHTWCTNQPSLQPTMGFHALRSLYPRTHALTISSGLVHELRPFCRCMRALLFSYLLQGCRRRVSGENCVFAGASPMTDWTSSGQSQQLLRLSLGGVCGRIRSN